MLKDLIFPCLRWAGYLKDWIHLKEKGPLLISSNRSYSEKMCYQDGALRQVVM